MKIRSRSTKNTATQHSALLHPAVYIPYRSHWLLANRHYAFKGHITEFALANDLSAGDTIIVKAEPSTTAGKPHPNNIFGVGTFLLPDVDQLELSCKYAISLHLV